MLVFETLLKVESFYNDIATVRNLERTVTVCMMLPVAWTFLYYTRLPDSVILWAMVNLVYLWPVLKNDRGRDSISLFFKFLN